MENYPPIKPLPISAWSEDDRPREKLMNKGSKSLTDAELLAIIIGSGSRYESAVSLAKRILAAASNNLNELGRMSLSELMKFNGVGQAKAISIAASLELGRRHQSSIQLDRPIIRSSQDAFNVLYPHVADLAHEEFWLLFLNAKNKILGIEKLSVGGTTSTIVDPKLLFRRALEVKADAVVLCHNHPSGCLSASEMDIELTKKMKTCGDLLGVKVLDHIIVGNNSYYSFADEGLIDA